MLRHLGLTGAAEAGVPCGGSEDRTLPDGTWEPPPEEKWQLSASPHIEAGDKYGRPHQLFTLSKIDNIAKKMETRERD
jgi:hypothetical protein